VTSTDAPQLLFSGPLSEQCASFSDLLSHEKWTIVPVTLLMFAAGIAPQFLFNLFNNTVVQMTRLFA
jgi:NADH:ubiquinone oxidoreductase subunit 4 (subunit M)